MKKLLLISLTIIIFSCSFQEKVQIWKFNPPDIVYRDTNFYNDAPIIIGDLIITGYDQNSGLFCLNKKNGKMKWHFSKGSSLFIVSEKIIYTLSDKLYALSIETGETQWSFPITSLDTLRKGYMIPLKWKDYLFFISGDKLYCINSLTRKVKWSYTNENINSTPVYYDKTKEIIVSTRKGKILFISSEKGSLNKVFTPRAQLIEQDQMGGRFVKETLIDVVIKPNSEIEYSYLIDLTHPSLFGDTLLFKDSEKLYSFDLLEEKLNWKVDSSQLLPREGGPVVFENKILIHGQNKTFCHDFATGIVLWEEKSNTPFSSLIEIDNKLYNIAREEGYTGAVFSWPQYLIEYDINTGRIINKIKTNNSISSPISYENGIIYFRSEDTVIAEEIML